MLLGEVLGSSWGQNVESSSVRGPESSLGDDGKSRGKWGTSHFRAQSFNHRKQGSSTLKFRVKPE